MLFENFMHVYNALCPYLPPLTLTLLGPPQTHSSHNLLLKNNALSLVGATLWT